MLGGGHSLSSVNFNLKRLIDRGRRRGRWWRGWGGGANSDHTWVVVSSGYVILKGCRLTVVDVTVVRDDLLDNRRADFRLGGWCWRRRWRGWGGRRSRRALFFAPDDDLISNDLTVVGGRWRVLARTADDKLFTLSGDQIAAVACWRWQTPLTASNRQGAPLSAGISAIAAELAAVGAKLKVAVTLLEANGAPLGGHIPTVAADLAARSMEVDISTATASEAHILALSRGGCTAGRGAVAAAEDNVLALDLAELGHARARLLAAPDCDVGLVGLDLPGAAAGGHVAVPDADVIALPHAGGRRRRAAAAHGAGVVEGVGAAGASGKLVFARAHNHLAGRRASMVVAEEVGGAAAGVPAGAATQLKVELVVVALAAVAAAVEVALALLVQLGGRVAARRHGGGAGEHGVVVVG